MRHPTLQDYVDQYLALRTVLGFRMRAERTLLASFVQFVEAHPPTHPLRVQAAVAWACLAEERGQGGGAAKRLSMVRQFLLYLRAHVPDTEVPGSHLIATPRRRPPYLFTPAQVVTLMDAARQVRPHHSLRPQTLSTLIGVLASTGIRIGEALRLRMRDVQLAEEPPRLHIVQSKFYKSRWVPLHPTTATQLLHYRILRSRLFPASAARPFFLSATGHPLYYGSLIAWFSKLCRQLGFWPTTASQRRPCLHSLRHAFAVRRLLHWYEASADIQLLLPHLSVYLGHVRPQESYWYLTATPELLGHAARRFQTYARIGGGV